MQLLIIEDRISVWNDEKVLEWAVVMVVQQRAEICTLS